jgi:hypothetical protein
VKREHLEHIVRAAASITGRSELVVIGSQAVLASLPHAVGVLARSEEADVFTLVSPDDAELIDGSIGEGSPFHRTFGYFAHGVGIQTAILPVGWRERLVPLRGPGTMGATAWCLEPHDLAVSKLMAGREKDAEFVAALLVQARLDHPTIAHRLGSTDAPPPVVARAQSLWRHIAQGSKDIPG